ncbi:hypothetical protein PV327_005882 [Microctonus hyperodae]|uniref:Peptidase M12B domain-containing protein n=1 Tax=Microctonus hyperodae TaxID=165561 RepID=A0AA39G2R6_MICHY|nr:hypothetical protein PV327_005882 [Microctonus hyperodae]
MIKDGETEIHLNLIKTKQLLANEHLPVWIAKARKQLSCRYDSGTVQHELQKNFVRENIGNFILYHDIEKSSAIVYYENTKTLHGMIDTRYFISKMPVNECNRADQVPATIFYPEILIFVPRDSRPNNVLATIVRHFITYFNGVDMLLAKLPTDYIKIHLNLAGIRSNVFSFMEPIYVPSDGDPSKKIRYLNVFQTLELASAYIQANRDIFSHDSFDFYFIPSKTDLWSTIINHEVEGISAMAESYTARLTLLDKYTSGFIVYHGNPSGHVTAAHELAHLLNIDHDSKEKGYCDDDDQCYAIMQATDTFCPDCLKWTNQNIENLKKFAKDHRNRCFLLNEPRSLHPYGYPMRTLSRLQQCDCYGYEHWPVTDPREYIDEVRDTDCDKNLICGKDFTEVRAILPLDGTPCANNKVCWNKVCQNIIYGSGAVFQGSSSQNK